MKAQDKLQEARAKFKKDTKFIDVCYPLSEKLTKPLHNCCFFNKHNSFLILTLHLPTININLLTISMLKCPVVLPVNVYLQMSANMRYVHAAALAI
jgi:hypothetical protein